MALFAYGHYSELVVYPLALFAYGHYSELVVYLLALFAYGHYKESLCCSEIQRCQFLGEEMSECGEDGAVCVTSEALGSSTVGTQKVNWNRQPKPAGGNGRLSTE